MKKFLAIIVVLFLAIPVALVVTILLIPLWRWIEATTGIESIGHSGPADWCFIFVYALTVLVALGIWHGAAKRAKDA